jgi:predicted membrane chloride channel (bestrophin family)
MNLQSSVTIALSEEVPRRASASLSLAPGGWTAQATATLIAAAVALLVGFRSVTQKRRADEREHWWGRTQWAFDQLADDDVMRTIGLEILSRQLDEPFVTDDDWKLLWDILSLQIDDLLGGSP